MLEKHDVRRAQWPRSENAKEPGKDSKDSRDAKDTKVTRALAAAVPP